MKCTQELPDWKEPTSLEDAETQAFALWEEIQSIQLQLADPNRIGENKQRLPISEYLTWQHRAKYALTMKIRTYRYLKQWIKDQRAKPQQNIWSCPNLIDNVRYFLSTGVAEILVRTGTEQQRESYLKLEIALADLDDVAHMGPTQ